MKYKCLSIAGFDGSGGAGIQADLKTFSAFGCYGMNVLTSLPIQNTCGVRNCFEVPPHIIEEQLYCIFEDITPDAIKIGMLFSKEIIEVVARFLEIHAKNIPIVLDPVMIAKSGDSLLQDDAIYLLKSRLLPIARIVTPNIPEAFRLFDTLEWINTKAVLLKGGHMNSIMSNDLLLENGNKTWLYAPRINSKNTHGTGCTLSAAITSCLAMGYSTQESCQIAKQYLYIAINSAKDSDIGKGNGPVNHLVR
jgi:hydroxymethylpyrimidine/phosphomethylpyrimidine kinase